MQGGIRFKKSRSDPRLRFQLCRLVGPFPTEFGLITAEMAVAGRLLVDRSPEIERLNDSSGRQVEVFANQFGDFVLVDSPATERVDAHGDRIGNADGVCQLNLDSLEILFWSIFPVPNVSTLTETGSATPMAYAS